MRRLLILGSTGLDRDPGARRRRARRPSSSSSACPPSAPGRRSSSRRAPTASRRIALADADAGPRRRGLDRRRGARRRRGPRAAGGRVRRRPRAQRARRARPGLGPTVATLGEGIDLALANKESLVVGGELVTQLAEATGAQIIPVDSEHSALHQLLAGERPGTVERLVLTASGGPFRGRTRAELEDVTGRGGARAPDLGDGRQDHDRLGDADEQGPRADRGPPPLRDAVRAHRRRRAPAVDRPRPGPPVRRRDARAPRLPRHARADLLRAAPPRARGRPRRDARPRRRWAR